MKLPTMTKEESDIVFIDLTGYALSKFCKKKNNQVFTLFCLREFQILWSMAKQCKTPEEFEVHLEFVYKQTVGDKEMMDKMCPNN